MAPILQINYSSDTSNREIKISIIFLTTTRAISTECVHSPCPYVLLTFSFICYLLNKYRLSAYYLPSNNSGIGETK